MKTTAYVMTTRNAKNHQDPAKLTYEITKV